MIYDLEENIIDSEIKYLDQDSINIGEITFKDILIENNQDYLPTSTKEEIEFEKQKEAFLKIPQEILVNYNGKFVISKDGVIVDSDEDLPTLTKRYIGIHGDTSIYIDKIGEEFVAIINTPFLSP